MNTFRDILLAGTAAWALLGAPAFAQDATAVSALQAPEAREGDYADVDGARIFYEARGDGPALMLLHGYPLSGALFARMRDELQENYTVVTVDHRGYGKSEAESNPGTVEQYARTRSPSWTSWVSSRRRSAACRWAGRSYSRCSSRLLTASPA